MKEKLLIFFLLTTLSSAIAQSFLNGSFEICSTTDCRFNINNQIYNSFMTNVRGIGNMQSLDILNDINCPDFGEAEDGHYYTSLENTNDSNSSTAISLELSDALQIGQNYSFSFYDRSLFGLTGGPIEIGVSSDDSTFGTLVYTTPSLANSSWTERYVSFISPITGNYITARYKYNNVYDGVFIDNFQGLILGLNENTDNSFITIYPNPSDGIFHLTLKNETEIEVYNIIGESIYKTVTINQAATINLSEEAKGIYFVKIVDNGKIVYKKIVLR